MVRRLLLSGRAADLGESREIQFTFHDLFLGDLDFDATTDGGVGALGRLLPEPVAHFRRVENQFVLALERAFLAVRVEVREVEFFGDRGGLDDACLNGVAEFRDGFQALLGGDGAQQFTPAHEGGRGRRRSVSARGAGRRAELIECGRDLAGLEVRAGGGFLDRGMGHAGDLLKGCGGGELVSFAGASAHLSVSVQVGFHGNGT
ncbi:hypothetical protein [Deinococcus sp. UR1]|uniref:hypothetical protein n=1 Tax=Deinococcus sp. UR1 TaxID=1704277 RepID=UPI000C18F7B5|nr:hypothetical protein [Deinococcus sp. UR1]PIG97506.1 hypothetical protein AMD26_013195 [Deinococcus sp. UR1]